MTQASWERRHPGSSEVFALDFFTPDASLGGFVGLSFHPGQRRCWYWAALVGEGRPYLLVRDLDVELPRLPASRQIRSEALWADLNCETPFEHWSLGLEAFGVAMDDPDEALRAERGVRTGLGLDLEWESGGGVVGGEGAYEQPGDVHGEILVGAGSNVETISFDGRGWRRHAWKAADDSSIGWATPPRSWLGGWLDDGTPFRMGGVSDELRLGALQRAPLRVEGEGGPATLERRLCRFQGPHVGNGSGWVEWLTPVASARGGAG